MSSVMLQIWGYKAQNGIGKHTVSFNNIQNIHIGDDCAQFSFPETPEVPIQISRTSGFCCVTDGKVMESYEWVKGKTQT